MTALVVIGVPSLQLLWILFIDKVVLRHKRAHVIWPRAIAFVAVLAVLILAAVMGTLPAEVMGALGVLLTAAATPFLIDFEDDPPKRRRKRSTSEAKRVLVRLWRQAA